MNVYQLSAKNCMSHLLLKDTFDTFLFIEGEFTTFNKFTISGYLQEDFFDEKLEETYSRWEKIRDFCFQIIRGKRTPLNFKIVLALPDDQIPAFLTAHGLTAYRPEDIQGGKRSGRGLTAYRPEDIQGLYLNFHYDGSTLQCITGTSLKTFSMDKSIEREWDTEVKSILKSKNIEGEY